MKITRMGDGEFRVRLARDEARILANCMRETFREGRGEGIRLREYRTRVGATVEDVKAIVAGIEAAWR